MLSSFSAIKEAVRPDQGDLVFPGKATAGAAFVLGAACIAVGLAGLIGSIVAMPFNPGIGLVGGFISFALLTTGFHLMHTAQLRLKALDDEAKNPPPSEPPITASS